MEGVDDVRLGLPEPPREGEELGGRQLLILDGEHLALEERLLDLAELRVRQRLRQVDAVDREAEDVRERSL
jgi:hypothetical protein